MKAIDIVKSAPTTEQERFDRWKNRLQSELQSMPGYGKRIKVKYIKKFNDRECPPDSRGRRLCEANGIHNWFSHSQDHAY